MAGIRWQSRKACPDLLMARWAEGRDDAPTSRGTPEGAFRALTPEITSMLGLGAELL